MFTDLTITIISEEPPESGNNLVVQYANVIETSFFSLSSLEFTLEPLNQVLSGNPIAESALQRAGGLLFDAIFRGKSLRAYMTCVARAHERGEKLRLRIISDIPSVIAIPWEYLYDHDQEQWLALSPDCSLVRSLTGAANTPAAVEKLLRVVVMIASPTDLPPLESEREWANLQALADLALIDLVQIEPTYEALQSAIRQSPHVFHFVGHGAFDAKRENGENGENGEQGYLAFCRQDGSSDLIAADKVASLLQGAKSLRLVLLNSCQGAKSGMRSAFAGVAQRLIQRGIPSVIAMQAPILDDHALRFSQEFYRALASGYTIEQAIGEGRKRIHEVSNAWGIPAFYFHGTQPFVIPTLDAERRLEQLWQKVQSLSAAGATRTRLQIPLNHLLELKPNHNEARRLAEQLQTQEEADRLYVLAKGLYQNERWNEAYRTFLQVEKLSPNYLETRSLMAEVLGRLGNQPPILSSEIASQVRHYQPLLNALLDGRLMFFLGYGASRFGRPPQDSWVKGGHYAPSGDEVARELSQYLSDPSHSNDSLLEVSQMMTLVEDESALFDRLYQLYQTDYPPTLLHRLLAELPKRLAVKGYPDPRLGRRYVIFTTAIDTMLERAFVEAGQPFHIFAYRHHHLDGSGAMRPGRFLHKFPNGEVAELTHPNVYVGHEQDQYPIIVKLCGMEITPEPDSVIVTEDQYLDYLPGQQIGDLLPASLLQQIRRRSLIFMGYHLKPWHLRLIMQRMKYQSSPLYGKSWVILPEANEIEMRFWEKYQVDRILAMPENMVAYVNDWLNKLAVRV